RDRAINAPAGNLDFFLGHRDLEGLLLFDHVLVNVDFAALDRARAGGELFLDDVDGLTVVVRVDIPVHDRAGIEILGGCCVVGVNVRRAIHVGRGAELIVDGALAVVGGATFDSTRLGVTGRRVAPLLL